MKHLKFIFAAMAATLLASCAGGSSDENKVPAMKKPADMSDIMKIYVWQKDYDGKEDRDSLLMTKLEPGWEDAEQFLIADTSFVLRVPEYEGSKQPFLSTAEDFYNCCALAWNVWSNYEVWYRNISSNMLSDKETVVKAIDGISSDIIKDEYLREAAQHYKDSLLIFVNTPLDEWENSPGDLIGSFSQAVESKAYRFYEDEEVFASRLDSVVTKAESLALDKFQRYLDASEKDQLGVILGELAACQTFAEQCSLWRNWANCQKSQGEDEWLIATGSRLMECGSYSPVLHRVWMTWRALCQTTYYGMSRDSFIPNHRYNEYRQKCYRTCLKYIESHPKDIFAINCAASLGGQTNINRFGQYMFGNEAAVECYIMMPKRFDFGDEEEEGEVVDESENADVSNE